MWNYVDAVGTGSEFLDYVDVVGTGCGLCCVYVVGQDVDFTTSKQYHIDVVGTGCGI